MEALHNCVSNAPLCESLTANFKLRLHRFKADFKALAELEADPKVYLQTLPETPEALYNLHPALHAVVFKDRPAVRCKVNMLEVHKLSGSHKCRSHGAVMGGGAVHTNGAMCMQPAGLPLQPTQQMAMMMQPMVDIFGQMFSAFQKSQDGMIDRFAASSHGQRGAQQGDIHLTFGKGPREKGITFKQPGNAGGGDDGAMQRQQLARGRPFEMLPPAPGAGGVQVGVGNGANVTVEEVNDEEAGHCGAGCGGCDDCGGDGSDDAEDTSPTANKMLAIADDSASAKSKGGDSGGGGKGTVQTLDEVMQAYGKRKAGGDGEGAPGAKKRGRPKKLPEAETAAPSLAKGACEMPLKKGKAAAAPKKSAAAAKAATKAKAKAAAKSSATMAKAGGRTMYGTAPSAATGLGCSKCRFAPRGCATCLRAMLSKRVA